MKCDVKTHTSVTGMSNKLCAVQPCSWREAARALVPTVSTIFPLLRNSLMMTSTMYIFPLPGHPSMNTG